VEGAQPVNRRAVVAAFKQFIQGATVRKPSLVPMKERARRSVCFFSSCAARNWESPF